MCLDKFIIIVYVFSAKAIIICPLYIYIASMLAVIVGAGAGGVALLLCLLLSCVIACWCYKSRKGQSVHVVSLCHTLIAMMCARCVCPENNNRKKNARVRLLGEDM